MELTRSQVVMSIDLGMNIPEDDPVRTLVEILDELDYTELNHTYKRRWRKYEPAMLFEILVCAYMNGIYSTRDIEAACHHDIRFMWLLQGQQGPDHATLARFEDERLRPAIEGLFYQLAEKLISLGEIDYKHVFIDGTKIEADANRYSFVWAKAVEKYRTKLIKKINEELPGIQKKHGIAENANIYETLSALLSYADMYNIEFVHGRGTKKTTLQRNAEKLTEYIEKLKSYEESLHICGKRSSYSKTDLDATFMRMKEDHMKNGQLKPGYNVQAAVQSEYIVALALFPNPADTTTLIPFLERMQGRIGRKVEEVVADAGYSSEENYTYLEENGQKAYIKPSDYEVKKTAKFRKDPFKTENLPYDEETDSFTCPNGRKLSCIGEKKSKSANGFETVRKQYACESCSGCPYRSKCYKGKSEVRRIEMSHTYARQVREATERLTSDYGIKLRMNRSIQVEGAFGVLKQDFGFRRFLVRGKEKTETQFFLLAIAYNIQKLYNRSRSDRFNQSLFEKVEEQQSS